jgi:hypothetical protein
MQDQAVSTPGTGPPQASKENPSLEMPRFFWWLCVLEFIVVLLIGLGVIALILYLATWIAFAWQPEVHARLVQTLNGMNLAWKAVFIILVPLFFRPIAKFLIYLKKVSTWESGLSGEAPKKATDDYEKK